MIASNGRGPIERVQIPNRISSGEVQLKKFVQHETHRPPPHLSYCHFSCSQLNCHNYCKLFHPTNIPLGASLTYHSVTTMDKKAPVDAVPPQDPHCSPGRRVTPHSSLLSNVTLISPASWVYHPASIQQPHLKPSTTAPVSLGVVQAAGNATN